MKLAAAPRLTVSPMARSAGSADVESIANTISAEAQHTIKAVSYTQLDVYKRQADDIPASGASS